MPERLNCLSAECSIESRHSYGETKEPPWQVSIAFRLNVRLRVLAASQSGAFSAASLNCLSAECSIERAIAEAGKDYARIEAVSIAFRLNVRLRDLLNDWPECEKHGGLNCLSAECSIESGVCRDELPQNAPGLNCLSAECSIESGVDATHTTIAMTVGSQLPFG